MRHRLFWRLLQDLVEEGPTALLFVFHGKTKHKIRFIRGIGGYTNEPFNPLALAIAVDASFVAQAFIGDSEQTKELMKAAITHKGFALLDIFQPCVTYNRVNTYDWFKKHTYHIDDSHDPKDRIAAFRLALESDKLPLDVFYTNPNKPTFEERKGVYRVNKDPVCMRAFDKGQLARLIESRTGV